MPESGLRLEGTVIGFDEEFLLLLSSFFSLGNSSKICRVDLSDVVAILAPEGEKEIEKVAAWSTPRRNSKRRASLAVDQTRKRVPVSLAVATIVSSLLKARARSGDL